MWLYFELVMMALLFLQVFYYLFYAIASIFPYTPTSSESNPEKSAKFALLIPGYKEDKVILDTAADALKQQYPKHLFDVVILADTFANATLEALKKFDVKVIEVKFENSTKAKSINYGLNELSPGNYEAAVILDADNLMCRDFLQKVNRAYQDGYKVIQGHRTAKNDNTSFALLDAINEEIGNSIFRKGHRVLNVSSGLIGSGMAFEFSFLHKIMMDIKDVAGEDKLMELKILKQRESIEYLPQAFVYDEKVSNATSFSKQRTRWVGVQIYFFKHYFVSGIRELLLKGNFGYFDKAFQMSLMPKVLLLGLLALVFILSALSLLHPLWMILTLIYCLALLVAIPRRFYNRRFFIAIVNIPRAIFYMLLGISKIRRSTASKFEVTEKGA